MRTARLVSCQKTLWQLLDTGHYCHHNPCQGPAATSVCWCPAMMLAQQASVGWLQRDWARLTQWGHLIWARQGNSPSVTPTNRSQDHVFSCTLVISGTYVCKAPNAQASRHMLTHWYQATNWRKQMENERAELAVVLANSLSSTFLCVPPSFQLGIWFNKGFKLLRSLFLILAPSLSASLGIFFQRIFPYSFTMSS